MTNTLRRRRRLRHAQEELQQVRRSLVKERLILFALSVTATSAMLSVASALKR